MLLAQAKNLVWADLSEEQLALIRNPHPKRGQSPRDLLAKFLGITDPQTPLNAISLDLYVHTLQFGQVSEFAHAWTPCMHACMHPRLQCSPTYVRIWGRGAIAGHAI